MFVVRFLVLNHPVKRLTNLLLAARHRERTRFWTRQVIGLITAVLVIIAVISIWVDNPAKLTATLGLVSAGLAFALQKVITSIAGYFVILRGKNFTVSDHEVRGVKDAIIREMLTAFNAASIGITSAAYDVVALPPVRVQPPAKVSPNLTP